MCAIVAAITICIYEDEEVERTNESPAEEEGDLVIGVGSLMVCKTGVTAKMSPPLQMLSRHYQWPFVPVGLASLRLVVLGEGRSAEMLYDKMSEREKDCFARRFPDSTLGLAAKDLWDWIPTLAKRCPYQSVVHDLAKLHRLNDEDLDKYVMSTIG